MNEAFTRGFVKAAVANGLDQEAILKLANEYMEAFLNPQSLKADMPAVGIGGGLGGLLGYLTGDKKKGRLKRTLLGAAGGGLFGGLGHHAYNANENANFSKTLDAHFKELKERDAKGILNPYDQQRAEEATKLNDQLFKEQMKRLVPPIPPYEIHQPNYSNRTN